jgi:hypothetical protein
VHIVKDRVEVLALVDGEVDDVGRRTLDQKRLAGGVVTDRHGRAGADVYLVALVLDLAFVVRVRDGGEHRRRVELLDQLSRPNLRNKRTGVRRRRVRRTCWIWSTCKRIGHGGTSVCAPPWLDGPRYDCGGPGRMRFALPALNNSASYASGFLLSPLPTSCGAVRIEAGDMSPFVKYWGPADAFVEAGAERAGPGAAKRSRPLEEGGGEPAPFPFG